MSELTLQETIYAIEVIEQASDLLVASSDLNLSVETPPVYVLDLSFNSPGGKGDQGPPAAFSQGSSTAGEAIAASSALVVIGGLAYLADITNIAHASLPIFISITSAQIGAVVHYSDNGEIAAVGLVADQKYSVGTGGTLVSTFRNAGAVWAKFIGVAKTSSSLMVQFRPTLIL